jgi:3-deoxy-D-manno-octulosonic-acid transferase
VVARVLQKIDLIAAQDASYAERFRALGAPSDAVRVTGSMKYDGAQMDRENPATQRLRSLAGFAAGDVVLLAGSTQEPEEAIALQVYRDLQPAWPQLRLVLVPRHPERFEGVARLLDASGLPWQRRTLLDQGHGVSAARILLVDVVGELGAWWGTARIAFVGGSLSNRGGQNMIEPAAYGAAVCFGPNTRNFRDIVAAMLARDAAAVVRDAEQFRRFVERCLRDEGYAAGLGGRAKTLVAEQLGATDRTLRLLAEVIEAPAACRGSRAAA